MTQKIPFRYHMMWASPPCPCPCPTPARAVKVGLIRDGGFFAWLERQADDLAVFERPAMAHMIRRCASRRDRQGESEGQVQGPQANRQGEGCRGADTQGRRRGSD